MRYLILTFIILCISLGSMVSTAEAGRFGGGKSFGMSRTISSNRNYSNYNSTVQRQAAPRNRWLGPLAGLAVGGLLASLFMGHGLGAGMMSWLMVAGVAFLLWRLFAGSQRMNAFQAQTRADNVSSFNTIEGNFASTASNGQYAQFDENSFLRQAKSTFIRLQAAYDSKNLADIRTYTSPEIFAEIQLQLQERGDKENITEVIDIHAELADLDIRSDSIVASVTYSGQVREERNAAPIQIKEIWHFQQWKNTPQWVVMGIQQA